MTNKVLWAVDTLLTENRNTVTDISKAIQNCPDALLFETKYIPLSDEQNYPFVNTIAQPVILYGSIGYVNKCKEPFYPGVYAFDYRTDFHGYMTSPLEPYMLNQKFFMLPFGSILNQIEFIFDTFGEYVFIRPNSGKKSFAGTTFNAWNYELELRTIRELQHVTDDEMCVIAPCQPIKAEYRIIIGNRKVIGYSQYRRDDILDIRRDVPEDGLAFANMIANLPYQPDLIYTLDIAEMSNAIGLYKIIELNAFNCSGLYAIDTNVLVREVTDIVLKDFNGELNG